MKLIPPKVLLTIMVLLNLIIGIRCTSTDPTFPEIKIKSNNQEIVNGQSITNIFDNTDFGETEIGGSEINTFTIENSGSSNLQLNGSPLVMIQNANSFDFLVLSQPDSIISPGDSTTFQI